jgi:hypothetical protein
MNRHLDRLDPVKRSARKNTDLNHIPYYSGLNLQSYRAIIGPTYHSMGPKSLNFIKIRRKSGGVGVQIPLCDLNASCSDHQHFSCSWKKYTHNIRFYRTHSSDYLSNEPAASLVLWQAHEFCLAIRPVSNGLEHVKERNWHSLDGWVQSWSNKRYTWKLRSARWPLWRSWVTVILNDLYISYWVQVC